MLVVQLQSRLQLRTEIIAQPLEISGPVGRRAADGCHRPLHERRQIPQAAPPALQHVAVQLGQTVRVLVHCASVRRNDGVGHAESGPAMPFLAEIHHFEPVAEPRRLDRAVPDQQGGVMLSQHGMQVRFHDRILRIAVVTQGQNHFEQIDGSRGCAGQGDPAAEHFLQRFFHEQQDRLDRSHRADGQVRQQQVALRIHSVDEGRYGRRLELSGLQHPVQIGRHLLDDRIRFVGIRYVMKHRPCIGVIDSPDVNRSAVSHCHHLPISGTSRVPVPSRPSACRPESRPGPPSSGDRNRKPAWPARWTLPCGKASAYSPNEPHA
ncbi:hypothetical protein BN871_BX_00750 [Paenibacillus sp. P22]|nr:hypothetical protein BN871_BX_00750 [Paenibacillus sp. P22]